MLKIYTGIHSSDLHLHIFLVFVVGKLFISKLERYYLSKHHGEPILILVLTTVLQE